MVWKWRLAAVNAILEESCSPVDGLYGLAFDRNLFIAGSGHGSAR